MFWLDKKEWFSVFCFTGVRVGTREFKSCVWWLRLEEKVGGGEKLSKESGCNEVDAGQRPMLYHPFRFNLMPIISYYLLLSVPI